MNRYGPRRKGVAPRDFLTANDILFVNEYMANGRNGTQAYLKVHPSVKYQTANVEAVRVLSKPSVADHVARLVHAAMPDTLESIRADLGLAQELARASGDPSTIASVAMDRAKLAGYLVDRQEVKTVDEQSHSAIRSLVGDAVKPRAN